MRDLTCLRDSLAAAGPAAAWTVFAAYLGEWGFDRILRYDLSGAVPDVRASFDDDWIGHYRDRGYAAVDPFPRYCARPGQSVPTGAAYLGDYDYLSPAQKTLIAEAGEAGFNAGFSLTLPDCPMIAWNIGSGRTRRDVEMMRQEFGGTLAIAMRLFDLHQRPRPALSRRESSVMHLLAAGYRSQEIAHQLGVASVTVDLHLRNARLKLGARTRDQALLIFAGLGGCESAQHLVARE
ncbi:MAG: LuxR C-terminal-related transcriptional regulator [Paracoccus sp. (in: a-proteobacteria)]